MMYVVAYDLRKKGKNYIGLYEQLENSEGWCHYLKSTWFISTKESPELLYKRLAAHLDENDYLFIMEFNRKYYGKLPDDAWNWIKEQTNKTGFYY